ncbi:queuosine precursor transporter [Sphingomonas sp. LB-2]|uniref:queuosine precursor transporter n=1 Tax=Sphingomonas caeni TaxID=2984949 RepID=UPI002231351E|nr:queuosine precursor transporter [Sphingomonas caeni]MCW3846352.1 queuosine precursor transporter [Sphingomonas caeni]
METTPQPAISRSLFIFSLFYGGMVCIAGVLGNKLVSLGPISAIGPMIGLAPLAVEAGIFAFLLLVAISSAVAEVHGPATANRLVRWGFLPLLVSMALIELVLHLPAGGGMDPGRLDAFETILGQSFRMMLAGLISYGTSQTLNVTIFSALKGREGSKLLWLRAAIASVLSQVVDTVLFISISFYGVFPIGGLMVGQMATKIVLSIVLVPVLIYIFVGLARSLDGKSSPA